MARTEYVGDAGGTYGGSDYSEYGGPTWEWEQSEGFGPSGQEGGRRYERQRAAAEKQAREEALQNWGYEQFFQNYGQDYLSGLEDYLPDYQQLLDRTGTTFGDIMGAGSEQQAQLMQGADRFRDIYDQGGYTGLERAQIQQAQQQAARAEQAQRGALQQQMAMRGMGGSGMEMMGALQAQQSGANQGLGAATDVATQAQNRALNALSQGTQFAGQAGQAADAFNKANLGWQDYQQQLHGQWQQQTMQNQAELARMKQEDARYRAAVGQAMAQGNEAPAYQMSAGDFGSVAGQTAQGAMAGYGGGS